MMYLMRRVVASKMEVTGSLVSLRVSPVLVRKRVMARGTIELSLETGVITGGKFLFFLLFILIVIILSSVPALSSSVVGIPPTRGIDLRVQRSSVYLFLQLLMPHISQHLHVLIY
jgi:hypothetical protein